MKYIIPLQVEIDIRGEQQPGNGILSRIGEQFAAHLFTLQKSPLYAIVFVKNDFIKQGELNEH